jgi:hypothetical protein
MLQYNIIKTKQQHDNKCHENNIRIIIIYINIIIIYLCILTIIYLLLNL